jgi:hypothetical protein
VNYRYKADAASPIPLEPEFSQLDAGAAAHWRSEQLLVSPHFL